MARNSLTRKEKKYPDQANWKIRPDLLKRVNQACLDRDVTQAQLAELVLDILESQSGKDATAYSPPEPERPALVPKRYEDPVRARLHRLLDILYTSGPAFRDAVRSNIETLAFSRSVAGAGHTAEDLQHMLDLLLQGEAILEGPDPEGENTEVESKDKKAG